MMNRLSVSSVKKLVAALALAGVGSAFAAPLTVNLTYQGVGIGGSYQTATITNYSDLPGAPINGTHKVSVGAFKEGISSSGSSLLKNGSSILAWCVDMSQWLSVDKSKPVTYSVDEGWDAVGSFGKHGVTPEKLGRLLKLFNQRYDEVLSGNTSLLSAAMQLAIWEIVAGDAPEAEGNFTGGKFTASGNNSATDRAQKWLGSLNTTPTNIKYRLITLNNDKKQDLITVAAVPLPGAALLFLSALGIGGFVRRARGKASV